MKDACWSGNRKDTLSCDVFFENLASVLRGSTGAAKLTTRSSWPGTTMRHRWPSQSRSLARAPGGSATVSS